MNVTKNTYNIQEVGLAKALVRAGHVCDVVLWTGGKETDICLPVDGKRAVHVFYKRAVTICKNVFFDDLNLMAPYYDIIQSGEYYQLQSWLLAKRFPAKTLIYHGPYFCSFNKRYNRMSRIFDRIFLPRYIKHRTSFLAKSDLARDYLVGKGVAAECVKTVGVGIDLEALTCSPGEKQPDFIDMVAKRPETMKLLYIGRMEPRRNILFLLDVLSGLIQRGADVLLVLVGDGEEEYVHQCTAYAKGLMVDDHIMHKKQLEQKFIGSLYECTDYFLLPTIYEIFGMVLLEAMYYKKVVLTTGNGGSSMLIENDVNGYRMPLKWEIWVDLLLTLQDNEKLRQKIGEAANIRVENGFLWDQLVPSFIEAYEGVKKVPLYENLNCE